MKTKTVKYFLKQFQESLNDYWTSIRRLKKIPKQIDQVIELQCVIIVLTNLTFLYFCSIGGYHVCQQLNVWSERSV